VYSLGCTLYYLLVGKAPFASGPLAERLRAHMNEPPPNLLEIRPDVPTAIAELYFRMMEKHPDARPQTAQEVADTLAAWLSSAPAPTRSGARVEPPRRAPRRASAEGSGTPGPRRQPGGVARSGPGSASGPLGSSGVLGNGSGSLPEGSRSGQEGSEPSGVGGLPKIDTSATPSRKGSGTRAGAPPATVRSKLPATPKAGGTGSTEEPVRPNIKTSWTDIQFQGLPILFWILFLAGIGTAIALAIAFVRSRG
jgi:serine/threonine protein kinase